MYEYAGTTTYSECNSKQGVEEITLETKVLTMIVRNVLQHLV